MSEIRIRIPHLAVLVEDIPSGYDRTANLIAQLVSRVDTIVATGAVLEIASGTVIDGSVWPAMRIGFRECVAMEQELRRLRHERGILRAAAAGRMGHYKFNSEDVDVMIGKLIAGESQVKVAKQIGCARQTLRTYLKRYGPLLKEVKAARLAISD